MKRIPAPALILGLAGLIPFLFGVITQIWPPMHLWAASTFGTAFVGPSLQLTYGLVICVFMSGVLWGFATRAEGQHAWIAYTLSVAPALWVFFMVSTRSQNGAENLMIGFTAIFLIDFLFYLWGLTPRWWMRLRFMLTAIVLGCLYVAQA